MCKLLSNFSSVALKEFSQVKDDFMVTQSSAALPGGKRLENNNKYGDFDMKDRVSISVFPNRDLE